MDDAGEYSLFVGVIAVSRGDEVNTRTGIFDVAFRAFTNGIGRDDVDRLLLRSLSSDESQEFARRLVAGVERCLLVVFARSD